MGPRESLEYLIRTVAQGRRGVLQTEHDISSTDEKDIETPVSWSEGGPGD